MRGLGVMLGVPKTEEQARVVIIRHASPEELEWFNEHPEDLEKRIDAILGRIEDDDVGTRWVVCKKHGIQHTAMKFGLDDRCGRCVEELLGRWKLVRAEPMKRPDLSEFYAMEFDARGLRDVEQD